MGERNDSVVTRPDEAQDPPHASVGAWAKSYYFAVRAAMEQVLRPYDLGTTQWYVLYELANEAATMQRDLARVLQIERATLSGVVATLVRKGLVDQAPSSEDQRQRVTSWRDAPSSSRGRAPFPTVSARRRGPFSSLS